MTKKRRDAEDFRELGAYLLVAREALLRAHTEALNMYRQDAPEPRRIFELLDAVDSHRAHVDNTWIRDLTKVSVPGAEPIYGTQHYESLVLVRADLAKIMTEAADARRTPFFGEGPA